MRRKDTQMKKGFTLIELMVVVAILGVLVVIALPQFAKYRRNAQNAAAKACLNQIASAQENYYLLNNTYASSMVSLSQYYMPEATMSARILSGDNNSWSAIANHQSSTDTFTYTSNGGGLL